MAAGDFKHASEGDTAGQKSWYAAPGITKHARPAAKMTAMTATDRLLRRLFAATQLLSAADFTKYKLKKQHPSQDDCICKNRDFGQPKTQQPLTLIRIFDITVNEI